MNTFYNKVLEMRKCSRPLKKAEKAAKVEEVAKAEKVETKPVISPKKKSKPAKKVEKPTETAVIDNDSGTGTES